MQGGFERCVGLRIYGLGLGSGFKDLRFEGWVFIKARQLISSQYFSGVITSFIVIV